MDLIKDFTRISKIIRWREPSVKFVASDVYAKSLALLPYNARLKTIDDMLKSCQLKTLLTS